MFTEARYAAVLVKRSDGSLGLKFHDLPIAVPYSVTAAPGPGLNLGFSAPAVGSWRKRSPIVH